MKAWGGNKSDEERGSVAEARASARGSQKRQSVRTEPLPTHTKDGASSGGAASTSGGMFADADALKGAAHKDLDKREFDIMDYYHTRGCMQCIGRHSLFGNATLVVIMLNSLWIGLEMDLNDAENLNDADWPFQFGEYFFFIYFSFEWIVRYGSLRRKRDGLLDKWFIFDSALVGLMWFETAFMPVLLSIITAAQGGPKDEEGGTDSGMGDLSMLRMFRLLRLTRMVRFMRAVPELVTLLKSMTIALRSVISTLTLLVLFMYIYAIVFKSQMSPKVLENEFLQDKFGSIPGAMWTLLMSGAFMDRVTECANTLLDHSPLLTVVFISFIFLASFTVLNMLIGMLCEVVTAVAAAEKEKSIVVFVKSRLFDALESLDKDNSGTISKDEFEKLLEIPAAVQALDELGVDVPNLVSMKNHLFEAEEMERMGVEVVDKNESGKDQTELKSKGVAGADDDSDFEFMEENSVEGEEKTAALAFADFLEMVIRLRADNRPSVLDIVDLRKLVLKNNRSVLTSVDGLEKMNGRLTKKMQDVTSTLDRFCTSHRQMLLGLPLEAPQGNFSASRSTPEAKPPPQSSLKLAGKANDVLVLDEPPRPVLESLDFFDRPESLETFDEAPFSNVPCESDPTGRPIAASGPTAAAAEAPGRPPEDPARDIFSAGDDAAPMQPSSSWMDPQERRFFNDAASSSHVSSISGDGDSIMSDNLDIECSGDTHFPEKFTL